MSRENQSRSNGILGAFLVRNMRLVRAKQITRLKTLVVRHVRIPNRIAIGISIIPALCSLRRLAVHIQLLPRIVLLDILPIPRNLIHRGLDGVNPPRIRIFSNTHRVPQTPSEPPSVRVEGVLGSARQLVQIEDLDLRHARRGILGVDVEVFVAAA